MYLVLFATTFTGGRQFSSMPSRCTASASRTRRSAAAPRGRGRGPPTHRAVTRAADTARPLMRARGTRGPPNARATRPPGSATLGASCTTRPGSGRAGPRSARPPRSGGTGASGGAPPPRRVSASTGRQSGPDSAPPPRRAPSAGRRRADSATGPPPSRVRASRRAAAGTAGACRREDGFSAARRLHPETRKIGAGRPARAEQAGRRRKGGATSPRQRDELDGPVTPMKPRRATPGGVSVGARPERTVTAVARPSGTRERRVSVARSPGDAPGARPFVALVLVLKGRGLGWTGTQRLTALRRRVVVGRSRRLLSQGTRRRRTARQLP